jgi:hypothetical protein
MSHKIFAHKNSPIEQMPVNSDASTLNRLLVLKRPVAAINPGNVHAKMCNKILRFPISSSTHLRAAERYPKLGKEENKGWSIKRKEYFCILENKLVPLIKKYYNSLFFTENIPILQDNVPFWPQLFIQFYWILSGYWMGQICPFYFPLSNQIRTK